jgi:peroxiredoxin
MVALRKSMEEEMGGEMRALAGKPAPDFTLEMLDGTKVTLSDLKGSVVVLDFWATWCGPCIISLPKLQKIDKEFAAKGVKVFAVNQAEPKDKVAAFIKERNLELTVLLDPEGQVNMQFKAEILPSTVIIGKDGVIRKVIIGYIPAEAEGTMRTAIEEVLKMPAQAPAKAPDEAPAEPEKK